MSTQRKVMIVLVALLGTMVLWSRFLGGLRGDEEAVIAAEEAAEQAEQSAQSAIDANAAAAAEFAAAAGSSDQIIAFAEQLPEIAVEFPQPMERWYEQNLMTPAELVIYNSGDSAETIAFTAPTYFANNPSCYSAGEQGDRLFQFELCAPQGDPTVVIGRSDVQISLGGWNGDCRAAHGWLFSRFFEVVRDENGNARPSGHHTKPWILPGSFTASVTQCLNAAQVDALRRHMDVTYTDWPISEEAWDSGEAVDEAILEAPAVAAAAGDQQVTVTAQFTMLFRPAHSLLCVPNLVGYLEASDDPDLPPVECPAQPMLEAIEVARIERGPQISNRVCLPRLPMATAVPDGDNLIAAFDPARWPAAAGGVWPDSLEGCSVMPLDPPVIEEEDADELLGEEVLLP